MPNPAGDFIWYELMTPDPAGAKAFYDAVVGWDIADAHDEIGYRMIGRFDGGFAGGVLPLNREMQEEGARPMWLGYLYVPDIEAALAAIEAAGGRNLMGPKQIDNVGPIALVTDPQGAPFYIMTPTPPGGDPDAKSDVFSPEAEQRVSWNELSTSDPAAARNFYGEQFGWTSNDFMPMGEMGEYRFIDHHGQRLGAMAGTMDGRPPHWRFYIRVPSIAKAQEAVEANGGRVANGPMEVPGGDHILIGFDPQGAEFALVGSK
jgi:predicted enzyme related to lactoylglutathione lyase